MGQVTDVVSCDSRCAEKYSFQKNSSEMKFVRAVDRKLDNRQNRFMET